MRPTGSVRRTKQRRRARRSRRLAHRWHGRAGRVRMVTAHPTLTLLTPAGYTAPPHPAHPAALPAALFPVCAALLPNTGLASSHTVAICRARSRYGGNGHCHISFHLLTARKHTLYTHKRRARAIPYALAALPTARYLPHAHHLPQAFCSPLSRSLPPPAMPATSRHLTSTLHNDRIRGWKAWFRHSDALPDANHFCAVGNTPTKGEKKKRAL